VVADVRVISATNADLKSRVAQRLHPGAPSVDAPSLSTSSAR
jgi:hypothetical protein